MFRPRFSLVGVPRQERTHATYKTYSFEPLLLHFQVELAQLWRTNLFPPRVCRRFPSVLHWYFIGTSLVLHWYFVGTSLVLRWYFVRRTSYLALSVFGLTRFRVCFVKIRIRLTRLSDRLTCPPLGLPS